jgi:hypothetical protein
MENKKYNTVGTAPKFRLFWQVHSQYNSPEFSDILNIFQ